MNRYFILLTFIKYLHAVVNLIIVSKIISTQCIPQDDMSWRVRGRGQLSHAIELACGAAQRLRALEVQWPTILVEMIEEILRDFSDMETHVKEHMKMLMDTM